MSITTISEQKIRQFKVHTYGDLMKLKRHYTKLPVKVHPKDCFAAIKFLIKSIKEQNVGITGKALNLKKYK